MNEGRNPKCGSRQLIENVSVGLDTQEGALTVSLKRQTKIGPLRSPGLVDDDLERLGVYRIWLR